MYEVEGTSSPPYTFNTAVGNSSPSIGALPRRFTDFYGHTQGPVYGRLYATNNWTTTAYLMYAGTPYTSPTSDSQTLKLTAGTSPVTCYFAEGPAGQPFSGQVTCVLKRRTKQTSGGWTTVQTWGSYYSETYSCDFSTYDYVWEIS